MPKPNTVSPSRRCSPLASSAPVGSRKAGVNPPAPSVARSVWSLRRVESIARPPSEVTTGRNGAGSPPTPKTVWPSARRTVRPRSLPQTCNEAGEPPCGAHVLLDAGQGRAGGGADAVAGQGPAQRPAAVRREGVVPDGRLGIEREPYGAALGRIGAFDGLRANPARKRGVGRQGEHEYRDRSHLQNGTRLSPGAVPVTPGGPKGSRQGIAGRWDPYCALMTPISALATSLCDTAVGCTPSRLKKAPNGVVTAAGNGAVVLITFGKVGIDPAGSAVNSALGSKYA